MEFVMTTQLQSVMVTVSKRMFSNEIKETNGLDAEAHILGGISDVFSEKISVFPGFPPVFFKYVQEQNLLINLCKQRYHNRKSDFNG
jgi:hypothetical protein